MHLAIGGCLKAPPVDFAITADTGGHIAYVIGAAIAQAEAAVTVSIVTRAVASEALPDVYARPFETFGRDISIVRLETRNKAYLEKEELEAELPELTAALIRHIHSLERRPDVVHAHFADAAQMAFAARDAFGIPVVYTPHALASAAGSPLPSSVRTASVPAVSSRMARERRALVEADAVVVSSRDEANVQIAAHGVAVPTAKLHRIPPGVPEHGMVSAAETRRLVRLAELLDDPAKPIILAIARPVRKKNLVGIVRAYRGSEELRHRANLVILAGRLPALPSEEQAGVLNELRDLRGESVLRGRFAMPADHSSADVADLYEQASRGGLFVNAALHEPFGLTLLEAAARGVPVVATMAGGARDIVEDIGHGILVDPQDDACIERACLDILRDREAHRAFSLSGLRNIGRYDWERFAERTRRLYFDLASRGVRPDPLTICVDAITATGAAIHSAEASSGSGTRAAVAASASDLPRDLA